MKKKIKNGNQKSRLRWFGHVMWMKEETIHKEIKKLNLWLTAPKGAKPVN